MTRNGKSVKISTKKVVVNEKVQPNINSNKNNQKDPNTTMPKPRRQRKQRGGNSNLERGILNNINDAAPLPAAAQNFIRYTANPGDPSGVTTDGLKVPDGAVKQSAATFARSVNTIVPPFLTTGDVVTEGKTYSMLFYTPPTLRAQTIIIVKSNDGELLDVEKQLFFQKWAEIADKDIATFPSWVSVSDNVFFTITPLLPLKNVAPPDVAGSTIIDAYRTVNKYLKIFFNTPDLLNQGTVVAHRTNTNYSKVNLEITRSHPNSQPTTLYTSSDGVGVNFNVTSNPHFQIARLGLNNTISAIFVSNYRLVVPGTSLDISVNDTYQYGVDLIGGNLFEAYILSGGVRLVLLTGTITGNQINATVFEQLPGGDELEETTSDSMTNLLTLPPFKQADIFQQNPGAAIDLLKTAGTVSVNNVLFDPVYAMQSGSDYHKVILIDRESDITPPMVEPLIGWHDLIYPHISSSIINAQSVPYAAKIFIEEVVANEVVAGSDSLIGWFVTKNDISNPEVVDVIKEIADCEPAGYATYDERVALHEELIELIGSLKMSERTPGLIKRVVQQVFSPLAGRVLPMLGNVSHLMKRR